MTLNLLFFTITIKKREISIEEAVHQEMVKRLYEENKDRRMSVYHFRF
nr:YrzI family small protein [Neobacillus sp. Marseille-Q6967]